MLHMHTDVEYDSDDLSPLEEMRSCVSAIGNFATEGDEKLNRNDIHLYASIVLAESAAVMADYLGLCTQRLAEIRDNLDGIIAELSTGP